MCETDNMAKLDQLVKRLEREEYKVKTVESKLAEAIRKSRSDQSAMADDRRKYMEENMKEYQKLLDTIMEKDQVISKIEDEKDDLSHQLDRKPLDSQSVESK